MSALDIQVPFQAPSGESTCPFSPSLLDVSCNVPALYRPLCAGRDLKDIPLSDKCLLVGIRKVVAALFFVPGLLAEPGAGLLLSSC